MNLELFPPLNASLNGLTALWLFLGFFFVKRRQLTAHKRCMIAATLISTVFLGSYLYYHHFHGATRFLGQGWVRPFYFTLLGTHTVLAAVQLPLILLTLFWAFRGQFERHKAIARITLPIWAYVSVTGVLIYFILYRIEYNS